MYRFIGSIFAIWSLQMTLAASWSLNSRDKPLMPEGDSHDETSVPLNSQSGEPSRARKAEDDNLSLSLENAMLLSLKHQYDETVEPQNAKNVPLKDQQEENLMHPEDQHLPLSAQQDEPSLPPKDKDDEPSKEMSNRTCPTDCDSSLHYCDLMCTIKFGKHNVGTAADMFHGCLQKCAHDYIQCSLSC